MKKKVKVALIGAGRIGFLLEKDPKRIKPASHFGMWYNNNSVNFVAVCDTNISRKNDLNKIDKKINFYSNPKKLLQIEKPDIVSISTWKDTHFKICKLCIEQGIKVIVMEKPLANNIQQSIELIKLIKKKKVKVLINHRRRFDTEVIKLSKQIKNGIIGNLRQVSCFYVYGILTTGTHLIDTLRMLLKETAGDIDKVIGIKNKFSSFFPKDDENIDGVLKFKNGLKAHIQSLNIKDYDIFDIDIYGTKGKIKLTNIGRSILHYKIINSPEHSSFTELSSKAKNLCKDKPRKQFQLLAQNALACLKNKKAKPLCDAYDSHKDMIIIDKLINSSKKNSKLMKIKF